MVNDRPSHIHPWPRHELVRFTAIECRARGRDGIRFRGTQPGRVPSRLISDVLAGWRFHGRGLLQTQPMRPCPPPQFVCMVSVFLGTYLRIRAAEMIGGIGLLSTVAERTVRRC
jgi:hypothetical protein